MKEQISILGAGISGIGAAKLAVKLGYDVFLSDAEEIQHDAKEFLTSIGVTVEEKSHTYELLAKADVVVKSPGIPSSIPIIQQLQAEGKEVISEIEWAYRHTKGKIIGITGSNGKTTTTNLVHHIIKNADLDVQMVGNIGISFSGAVADRDSAYYVVEISSFQLDDINSFRPDIAILLNITPDHLNRYNYNLEEYVAAKFKITSHQTEQDSFIYYADDQTIQAYLENHPVSAKQYTFSKDNKNSNARIKDNKIMLRVNNRAYDLSIDEFLLKGSHNHFNSMAAGIAASILEIKDNTIRESLVGFPNLEHRMEMVFNLFGIDFVNDSKATNVNSTWYALETIEKPCIWIAGGVDKGNDYEILKPLVKDKVKGMICLGKDNTPLVESFVNDIPKMAEAKTMQEAVSKAYLWAENGDVVLLSPCCASFDLFDDFEDRGDQFKKAVRALGV